MSLDDAGSRFFAHEVSTSDGEAAALLDMSPSTFTDWRIREGLPHYRDLPMDPRFWARVEKGPGCWEWQGHRTDQGYGQVRRNERVTSAHRHAYQLFFGPVPDDMHVCHDCDNPPCVRPSHLHVGTPSENIREAVERTEWSPDGAGRGEAHPRAKLTANDVREIRARYAEGGVTQYALADEFGVSQSVIWHVVHHKTWRDV